VIEKDIIRERVKAGLENVKRKGKRLGRPPVADSLLEKTKAHGVKGYGFAR